MQQKGHVALVTLETLRAHEVAEQAWHRRREAFLTSPAVEKFYTEAEAALEALPSHSARQAVLSGIAHTGSAETFRRAMASREVGWLKRYIGPDEIPHMMRWLNTKNPAIEVEAKAIGQLWRESQAPLPEEEIIYKKKTASLE